MYTSCLRCDRALGTNIELPHLRVGRRVAFDITSGRIWVICPACAQWNLVPADERWEALGECDRVANAWSSGSPSRRSPSRRWRTGSRAGERRPEEGDDARRQEQRVPAQVPGVDVPQLVRR
jgi:hypothetical protein